MWMNEGEIDQVVRACESRGDDRPIAKRAAKFLWVLMDETNSHSDGWPYWSAPSKAANKLMELLKPYMYPWGAAEDITEADYKRALVPIKAFYTRRGYAAGMEWPSDE